MKVALIVGHAPDIKGNLYKGINEFDFWSEILGEVMKFYEFPFDNESVKLFYRPYQRKIGYHEAVRQLHKDVDAWGADVDIEFHFNGSDSHKVKGHEIIYSGSVKSKEYAIIINDIYNRYALNRDRGTKKVKIRGSYQLKVGKSVSIISEAFFANEVLDYIDGGVKRSLLIDLIITFIDALVYYEK